MPHPFLCPCTQCLDGTTTGLAMPPVKPPRNDDSVNHPKHYTAHPSGIECIDVTEHMGFNLGNATKYIWRCDEKLDAIEDLKKAVWYLNREIEKRTRETAKNG